MIYCMSKYRYEGDFTGWRLVVGGEVEVKSLSAVH